MRLVGKSSCIVKFLVVLAGPLWSKVVLPAALASSICIAKTSPDFLLPLQNGSAIKTKSLKASLGNTQAMHLYCNGGSGAEKYQLLESLVGCSRFKRMRHYCILLEAKDQDLHLQERVCIAICQVILQSSKAGPVVIAKVKLLIAYACLLLDAHGPVPARQQGSCLCPSFPFQNLPPAISNTTL